MSKHNTIVSVLMLTYNHEKYVETAIKSILCQKTNFCFELLIGEDCSTDNTRQIVIEYENRNPDIIRTFLSKQNVGPLENEKTLIEMVQGKYIAFCEGDDYWTDEYKLQKQVDFLEANPDYGLVHGDVNHFYQATGTLLKNFNKTTKNIIPNGNIFEEILLPGYVIKTMTACFRKEITDKHFSFDLITEKKWKLSDMPLWLEISKNSKIHYINETFATYRILQESTSHTNNHLKRYLFHLNVSDIRKYYIKKYGCTDGVINKIKESEYKTLLLDAYLLRNKSIAISALKELSKEKFNIIFKTIVLIVFTLLGKILKIK